MSPTSSLHILTVDDEPLALRRLQQLLRSLPEIEHVGEASGCTDALASIERLRPDLVLLDVSLRDGSGFEVIDALAETADPPAVVLVTAFVQYAVPAFDRTVIDFLVKPIDRDRLARALHRVRQARERLDAEQRAEELQHVLRNIRSTPSAAGGKAYESEFWVRNASGLQRVPVDAIDYVESADIYVSIHTVSGVHMLRSSIRQFESRVEPGLFVRVHRRWLVRRCAIVELSNREPGRAEVVLRCGKRIPAGRVHAKSLKRILRTSRAAAA